MFGFLRRRSAEIGVLLERVDLAEQQVPDSLRSLASFFFDELRSAIKSEWKPEHDQNYVAEIRRGETHEAFIYNFLVHSTANRLESGRYHAYRGVLGAEGTQLKALFEYAINTMIERGGYTKEWADDNLRRAVYKSIKEVG